MVFIFYSSKNTTISLKVGSFLSLLVWSNKKAIEKQILNGFLFYKYIYRYSLIIYSLDTSMLNQ